MKRLLPFSLVLMLVVVGCGGDSTTDVQNNNNGQIAYEQAVAEAYAPLLFFDSKQGETNKCFPGDAAAYYAERKAGKTQRICNTSYNTIQNGEIPVYFQYASCDTNTECLFYWFFYGWQDYCSPGAGAHNADWEHIALKIVDGKLDRVMFFQHEGQYTKVPGNYLKLGTDHPIVYVGKNSHGSYHDDGGSGTCCYYEDFRNPGSPAKIMATWQNLVRLSLDANSPEWMKYDGVTYWDGLKGPLHRSQDNDLCHLQGGRGAWSQVCNTCGCAKSDIGDNEM